jgi:hypothetical protein
MSISGRWDLVVDLDGDAFPSWVELGQGEGRFVGRVGSARAIPHIEIDEDRVLWRLPKQYESRQDDMEFEGQLEGDALSGTTRTDDGRTVRWIGKRAQSMEPSGSPHWGEPVELIGSDLSNWEPRSPEGQNNWSVRDGMLVNSSVGSDLVTKDRFMDFKLVAEFSYPPKSNSGIYLRGRYEVQILDDYGKPSSVGNSGAIYGFIEPTTNAVKPAEEWNVAEITLLGRYVTIVLNGETVIDNQEIPGITGGALDSDEGAPGPLFLQGDHGPVTFRRLTLIPAL